MNDSILGRGRGFANAILPVIASRAFIAFPGV